MSEESDDSREVRGVGEDGRRCGLAISSSGGVHRTVFVTCGTCKAADLLRSRCPELVVYDPSRYNFDSQDDSDGYGDGYSGAVGLGRSPSDRRIRRGPYDGTKLSSWPPLTVPAGRVFRLI